MCLGLLPTLVECAGWTCELLNVLRCDTRRSGTIREWQWVILSEWLAVGGLSSLEAGNWLWASISSDCITFCEWLPIVKDIGVIGLLDCYSLSIFISLG